LSDGDGRSPDEASPDGGGGKPGAATWSRVALPADVRPVDVAADGRSAWLAELHGTPWSVGAGRLAPDGAYARVYEKQTSATLLPNYTIEGIAPIDEKNAVITGEWFSNVIGDASESLSTTTSYGTAVFARSAAEIWIGSRVGVLQRHAVGAKASPRVPLVDQFSIGGLWATTDGVYLATSEGLRVVPQPLPADWNGDAKRVAQGAYHRIAGLPNEPVAYATGGGGIVARYDGGGTWTVMSTGTTAALGPVAVAKANDAWVASDDELLHFDGTTWTRIEESGAPAHVGSLAALPDGTLYAVAEGALYRRAPGVVAGAKTGNGAWKNDGGAGACSFAEPNDDGAHPLSLPASFDACAPLTDKDLFTFVPPSSNAGGFVTIAIDDEDSAQLLATVNDVTRSPQTELWWQRALNGGTGASLRGYVAVAPMRRYDVFVGGAIAKGTGAYHADLTFTAFDDAHEPNNAWEDAAKITTGAPARGIMPTRLPHPYDPKRDDDADWYLASHAAGAFTITLSDVPPDARARLKAYFTTVPSTSMGSDLGTVTAAAAGETVTLSGTLTKAGSIRIAVEDLGSRAKTGAAPPPGFVQQYTLVVSP